MQRRRGPRRVFIWGNGNQAAHNASAPSVALRPKQGTPGGRCSPGSATPPLAQHAALVLDAGRTFSALAATLWATIISDRQ